MKSFLSIIIILSFFNISFAQNGGDKITDKHIKINGTDIYIIPPNGFVTGAGFVGLNDTISDAVIIIQKRNESELKKVSSNNFKTSGRTAYYMKKNTNSKECHYLEIQSSNNTYYIIEGNYSLQYSTNYSEEIKKSLESVIIK